MTRTHRSRPAVLRRLLFGLVVVIAFVAALGLAPGAAEARTLVHYQKNMAFGNNRERALANDILKIFPDTVTLQEVNRDNNKILRFLRASYPSQNICTFEGIGRVAVLSRWPIVQGSKRCLRGQGITAIQVRMPEGPVWVMSVHLEVPGSGVQTEMAKALDPELRAYRGPKIIAGDFNAIPLAGTVIQIARAAGVDRIGAALGTFNLGGFFKLPIDHVFATGGQGTTETRPLLGSDHLGVVARFTMQR